MFEVRGYLKKLKRPFVKKVEAKSEKHAVELVMSLFGAQNGLKRTSIVVEEVKRL